MRIRDRDGNTGEVNKVHNEDLVGICADGLWLTPAQARRFAAAICRAADRVDLDKARTR